MSNYSLSVPSSKIHLCYMRPTTNGVSKINKSVQELSIGCVSHIIQMYLFMQIQLLKIQSDLRFFSENLNCL